MDVAPIESHRRSLLLDAVGSEERGEAGRALAKERFAPRLGPLSFLPLPEHPLRVEILPLPEDVRVARDHLRDRSARDRRGRGPALLLEAHREEGHQEEQIPHLLRDRGPVAVGDGVGDLMSLLDGIGRQRP